MLNFKVWLEGFRVNYSKLPRFLQAPINDDDFEKFLQKPSNIPVVSGFDALELKGNEKEVIDELHKIEELIIFDIEKRSEDFINTSFSNDLNFISIRDSQKLSSFKSKILYGMKFEMKEEKVVAYFREKVKKLTEEYNEMINTRKSIDIRLNTEVQKVIIKIYQDLLSKGTYIEHVKKYILSMIAKELDKPEIKAVTGDVQYEPVYDPSKTMISSLMIGKGKSKTKLDWKKINQIINHNQSKSPNSPKLRVIRNEIKALKEVLDKFQNNVEYKDKWHNILQQVFLKKTKHPVSDKDKKLQEHFVQLSVQNFIGFIKEGYYDIILYPESSSQLNQMIATKLSEYYSCEAVMGFKKKELVTIDVHNFIKKYKDLPKEKLTGALSRLRDQIVGSNSEIKRIHINQAFVRNWDINKEILKKIDKKIILVVDDNLRSGGTLQSINKVLWNVGNPRSVSYYVPLWANFS